MSEPQFEIRGGNPAGLTSDYCDINTIFQLLQRLGDIPGVNIPVTSCREVFDIKSSNIPWLASEVGNINNDKLLCDFWVEQGKNKVRAAEAGVHRLDIAREFETKEFLNNRGSEPVIGKEGISTPCNHNFRKQHQVTLTG